MQKLYDLLCKEQSTFSLRLTTFWVKLFKQSFLSRSVCVHKSYSVLELVHIDWHELKIILHVEQDRVSLPSTV